MDKERKKLTIKINQGEEYKIRLGCVYENDSFFYDAYRRGAKILKETLTVSQRIRTGTIWKPALCAETEDDNTYEFPNNIIAFCGGRGEGKSSAMRTFAHALECLHIPKGPYSTKNVNEFWEMQMENYLFVVLPVIDPTMMREQDSFMRVILSRMFAQLRNYWDFSYNNDGEMRSGDWHYENPNRSLLEKVLSGFRDCYSYLDILGKKPDIDNQYDDLKEISDLGDSASLKTKFRQLVKDFLTIMNPRYSVNENNTYLILQIDDADLNIRQAYGILEDIRSYCIVPEVLILTAMNIQQLYQIIEQHYIQDLEPLLKYSRKDTNEEVPLYLKDCRRMSVRYVDKVIPGSRQIHLPQIDMVLKNGLSNLSIAYYISDESNVLAGNHSVKASEIEDAFIDMKKITEDYQECLLGWIYLKTGIALIKPATYRHNFLPGHLRELTHFLAFFDKMKNLDRRYNLAEIHSLLRIPAGELKGIWREKRDAAIKARELWLNNLQNLEQYFLMNWAELHLNREGKQVLQELMGTSDMLKGQVINAFCDEWYRRLHMQAPTSASMKLVEYSYAFVMKKLDLLSEELKLEEDYCVVYALRFYYMLLIYKKLLVLAGDDNGYKQMIHDLNFETWVLDYAEMTEDFPYGRFEINLHALCKLRTEFSANNQDINELSNNLKRLLYIRLSSGKGRYVQRQDFSEVSRETKNNNKNHAMFDWSYFLMSILLGRGGNYSIPPGEDQKEIEDWENRMDYYDMAFQFLFNWDVQHNAEKNLQKRDGGSNRAIQDMSQWFAAFWKNLVGWAHKMDYIMWPVKEEILSAQGEGFPLKVIAPHGFDILFYGNRDYVKNSLVGFGDELKKMIKNLGNPKVITEKELKGMGEIAAIVRNRLRNIEGCSVLKETADYKRDFLVEWERQTETKSINMDDFYSYRNACEKVANSLSKVMNQQTLTTYFGKEI